MTICTGVWGELTISRSIVRSSYWSAFVVELLTMSGTSICFKQNTTKQWVISAIKQINIKTNRENTKHKINLNWLNSPFTNKQKKSQKDCESNFKSTKIEHVYNSYLNKYYTSTINLKVQSNLPFFNKKS